MVMAEGPVVCSYCAVLSSAGLVRDTVPHVEHPAEEGRGGPGVARAGYTVARCLRPVASSRACSGCAHGTWAMKGHYTNTLGVHLARQHHVTPGLPPLHPCTPLVAG